MVAQGLRCCAVEPRNMGLIPAVVAAFMVEAESESTRVLRFWGTLKIPSGKN